MFRLGAVTLSLFVILPDCQMDQSWAEDKPPVQVFILAGQSNMEGKARMKVMEFQAFKGRNQQRYRKFVEKTGKWKIRNDVFVKFFERHGKLTVGYGSPNNIGPELDFGFTVGDHIDAPVLLIKTAWGGKTLGRDFRPPSSKFPDAATLQKELERYVQRDPKVTLDDIKARYGLYYRKMVEEVRETLPKIGQLFPELEGRRHKIAGMVWFQGWNEQYNDAYIAEYSKNLHNLIRDVRKEFGEPKMPFVVGEFGADGPKGGRYVNDKKLAIRAAQASVGQVKEFQGNVLFVPTTPYWDKSIEQMYEDTKKIRGGLANGKMTEDEAQAIRDRFARHGSDKGYHYLGSPKIFCDMGRAFGEGMIKLIEQK